MLCGLNTLKTRNKYEKTKESLCLRGGGGTIGIKLLKFRIQAEEAGPYFVTELTVEDRQVNQK